MKSGVALNQFILKAQSQTDVEIWGFETEFLTFLGYNLNIKKTLEAYHICLYMSSVSENSLEFLWKSTWD